MRLTCWVLKCWYLMTRLFFLYSITQTSVWVQILRVYTWLYMLQIYSHFLPVNMSERSWSYWAPAAASGPSRDSHSIHHKSGSGSSVRAREKRQGERGRITVQKVRERETKSKSKSKIGKKWRQKTDIWVKGFMVSTVLNTLLSIKKYIM